MMLITMFVEPALHRLENVLMHQSLDPSRVALASCAGWHSAYGYLRKALASDQVNR
jgi:hypothetical protein